MYFYPRQLTQPRHIRIFKPIPLIFGPGAPEHEVNLSIIPARQYAEYRYALLDFIAREFVDVSLPPVEQFISASAFVEDGGAEGGGLVA
jgi:hypothetical protein